MATPQNSRNDGKSSIEAATEAIAKVNAMLIAKGKLKPSQLNSNPGAKKTGPQSFLMTMEVEINDVPIGCRNMLTRGSTQEEISKMSGAAVATRGRYMTPEERANNPSERALYLSVQATAKEAVDLAVGRINEIITNGIARQGAKMSKFSPPVIRGPAPPPPRGLQPGYMQEPGPPMGPPQPMAMPTVQNIMLYQEKLVIGLEHAPPNFSVKDKVFGPGGTFLQHIQAETGCKVTLRGRGSGFIEQNGTEAMEPMHIHLQHVTNEGLQQAKNLATNLIQTVQQEYAAFQQSFVSVPPPNLLPQSPYMIPPPQLVSVAKPPPLLPGQPIASMSMAPPAPMLQPPPQNTFLTPPPAVPGQMIPPQPLQSFPPPSSMGQPLHQYIQASEQQMLSVPVSQPPPMMVSMSNNQQPGQMVITSMTGQHPLQTPVQQIIQQQQQQLPPPGSYQLQQPQQPGAVAQQIIQQPGIQPTGLQIQQTGLQQQQHQQQQQQIGLQQQAIHQQTVLQPQPAMTGQQPIYQQPQQPVTNQFTPTLQPGLQQLPTSMQTTLQHFPPGIQHIQQQQQQLGPPPVQQQVQQVPVHQQQQYAPGTIQTPTGSWVPPHSSYQPVYAMSHQVQTAHSHVLLQPQQSQQSMIMTSAQPQLSVSTTPSGSAPVWSTPTSSYVYTSGPKEEPKRRFTETKQDDKVPDNLLGYEHGPPHLANLVVQPGQPTQQSIQQPQPHSPGSTGQMVASQDKNPLGQGQQFEPNQPPNPSGFNGQGLLTQPPHMAPPPQTEQQRHDLEERVQGGGMSPSPGAQPVFVQQQTNNGDKSLMPPPPPPAVTGAKRQSPSLSPQPGPERKKTKGLQDEEEEGDVPSSLVNQVKEFKKYSYNQYSGNAQLYQSQEQTTQNFDGNPLQSFEEARSQQQAQSSGVPDPHRRIQSPTMHIVPGSQSPAPPPPNGEPSLMAGFQSENYSHFLQYQSYSQSVQQMNPSVYIVSSHPPQGGYVQTSMAHSYSPHQLQSSPSFISSSQHHHHQQQQQPIQSAPQLQMPPSYLQPPPPPPLVEDTRLAPAHEGPPPPKEVMDGRGMSGFNPSYLQYSRDIKNNVHQPPPPPPPPRSYW